MKATLALVLLAICSQGALASSMHGNHSLNALNAISNHTINALMKGKLVKGVLVKSAKHAVQSSFGVGAGLAAGALSGLPVTTFAPPVVSSNPAGAGFCFPKYRAAIVEKPQFACGPQYSLNITKLGAACVKRTYTKVNTCFKSLRCPSAGNYEKATQVCLPAEIRSAMVGMLTVFKVKATLPFVIIPSLKKAVSKAVLAPVVLPKSLLLSMQFNFTEALGQRPGAASVMLPHFSPHSDDANVTVMHPGDLVKLAFEDLSQAGEGVMRALVNGSSNPLDIVTKGILNCNVSDIKAALPEINNWVASKLQGLNISDISEAINETFPTCLSKCCRPDNHIDTALVMPSTVCPNGTGMNNLLGLCVGGEMGYAPCPESFSRCMLPNGVPMCHSEAKVLGMETCKVAGALMHNLPKLQCPSAGGTVVAEAPAANATDASSEPGE